MDYPPTGDDAKAVVDSFTPDPVCGDVLAAADATGANRFAWYGYSWSGVLGLQLAARRSWPEREAISCISCPRMAFAGAEDVIVSEGTTFRVGPLLAEHRAELEEMGWTVATGRRASSRYVHESRCHGAVGQRLSRSDFDLGIESVAIRRLGLL